MHQSKQSIQRRRQKKGSSLFSNCTSISTAIGQVRIKTADELIAKVILRLMDEG